MMDKIPDCSTMILDLFRERQRLAHHVADPLSQCVVHALDMARLSAVLADWTMPFRWQYTCIRFPEIRGTDCTLAIDAGQRFPQLASRRFITCPNRHPDTFSRVAVTRQPDPLLCVLGANKRPQFVTFDRQSAFFSVGANITSYYRDIGVLGARLSLSHGYSNAWT